MRSPPRSTRATKTLIVRKILITATVLALILVGLGEFLSRLLHFSTASLSIAGGNHPVHHRYHEGPRERGTDDTKAITERDPMRIAVFRLVIPHLLSRAGIVALVILSAEADSVAVSRWSLASSPWSSPSTWPSAALSSRLMS